MGVPAYIWENLESYLRKNKIEDAIVLLEAQLAKCESAEDVANLTRRISHLYCQESPIKNNSKAKHYAFMAGEAYVKQGRMAPAVALVSVLKAMPDSEEFALRLQRLVSQAFSLPVSKKKATDEDMPIPTPYQEMAAIVAFEPEDGSVGREQWSWKSKKKAPLFSWLKSNEVFELIHLTNLRELSPGMLLFREGDEAESFYIVAEGEMELSTNYGFQKTFKEGDCFGEIALFAKINRTATLHAGPSGAKLLEFSETAMKELFKLDARMERKVANYYEYRIFLNSAPRHVLFKGMTVKDLEKLWDDLTPIRVPKGRVLLDRKDPSSQDRFYFIVRGRVQGILNDRATCLWRPGTFLGRTAAADKLVAVEETYLLEIHKMILEERMQKFPELRRAFDPSEAFDFFEEEETHVIID